ncbi:MAG: DUF1934 domain-containing protein [Lachnospiraceae bacterium]|nr:DUF1934 domain-containing protein [Lachnospiraceae bacterium]
MTKNVIISLTGLQYAVEEAEAPIEVINFGQYYKKGETHYLFYEDTGENGTSVKCRIKVSRDELELQKRDRLSTRLLFMPGEKYFTNYETPYGSLLVGVATQSLEFLEEEEFLRAKLRYDLEINNERTADCTLILKVQSCRQETQRSEDSANA